MTPVLPPPSKPLTDRQREILREAQALVEETGLANLTLKRVAERVGFTEGAIYRHFASKRELIVGLIGVLEERLLGVIAPIAGDRSSSPRARIERMVREHVRILRSTRGLPLILVAEGLATGDEELVARLGRVMASYRTLLGNVLDELALPLPVPGSVAGLLFLGLPAALGLQLRAHPDLELSEAQIDALVSYYVRGLTEPAGATDRETAR